MSDDIAISPEQKFGRILAGLRRERGQSQAELARLTEIKERTLRSYEYGERAPKREHANAIADALGVDREALWSVSRRLLKDLPVIGRRTFLTTLLAVPTTVAVEKVVRHLLAVEQATTAHETEVRPTLQDATVELNDLTEMALTLQTTGAAARQFRRSLDRLIEQYLQPAYDRDGDAQLLLGQAYLMSGTSYLEHSPPPPIALDHLHEAQRIFRAIGRHDHVAHAQWREAELLRCLGDVGDADRRAEKYAEALTLIARIEDGPAPSYVQAAAGMERGKISLSRRDRAGFFAAIYSAEGLVEGGGAVEVWPLGMETHVEASVLAANLLGIGIFGGPIEDAVTVYNAAMSKVTALPFDVPYLKHSTLNLSLSMSLLRSDHDATALEGYRRLMEARRFAYLFKLEKQQVNVERTLREEFVAPKARYFQQRSPRSGRR